MPFRLREGLSFCVCGDRVILLDLKADRYLCLAPPLEFAFARWAGNPSEAGREDDAALLLEHGLLVPASQRCWPVAHLRMPPATSDLLSMNDAPSCIDVAQVIAAELSAAIWLRRRPLIEVVRRCGSSEPRPNPTAEAGRSHAVQIAAAFERSALLLGASDRCLARAVAAMIACHRRGVYPTLIFGVRVDPFAAHCWVQIGEAVLVGDYEQVRLFTPILTVQ